MTVYAESNSSGAKYQIEFEEGNDEGAYLVMTVTDDETGEEIVDALLINPPDVDQLYEDITRAVEEFRKIV